MMEGIYKIGLDVGSTTAKIAVFNENNDLVYSHYERHHAKVGELVNRYFSEINDKLGDIPVTICVTGSVGMATADELKAEFVQEVVASTVYARTLHPEAKALIDIGGEDAKVVFFNGKQTELRMNGNCAGGTGAFLDQMAVLMGIDNGKMNDLALKATHVYPMAARCGVFAKTDIQNLMSRNIPEEDIAASIFHSIAVQTVTTLSHGCDYEPPILLCGGPLTFMPALRKAFAEYLKLDVDKDFIVNEKSNLIPAMGCAIRAGQDEGKVSKDGSGCLRLSELQQRLNTNKTLNWHSDLKPLFKDEEEHQLWREEKLQYAMPMAEMKKDGTEKIFIGIDSGSTTTKTIASREDGKVIFADYSMNLGNPIGAVETGLKKLMKKANERNTILEISGSCSTGYGEELIKKAFNLDDGIIETMAHYRAARSLMPDVSFILDIGGQDMKAIFVDNGVVVRMELNEACSSGCGTFLQTFANNLDYSIQDFANIACTAKAPCDLGTRCTVFMNSKVKQVMREGASVADISAGLSYSVVKNCLYKVLKLRGNDDLGNRIVVQGGTMRNDSVVRAFELLTGHSVARSDMPELMGAYGCALHAISEARNIDKTEADQAVSPDKTTHTIDDLLAGSAYTTRQLQCKGCENHCYVSQYKFAGGNRFYSGNKCERIFNNYGKNHTTGENAYTYKYKLLFDRNSEESKAEMSRENEGSHSASATNTTIGIPRVLGMYEEYPFWHSLFTSCGFNVLLSSPSTYGNYESQLRAVMSDNICFPAKLVHSHIAELDRKLTAMRDSDKGNAKGAVANSGTDKQKVLSATAKGCCNTRIFFPYVVYERKDDKRNDDSYNCPIVSAYSDVVRSSMNLKTQMDSPVITFADDKLLWKQIRNYLKSLGVSARQAKIAFMRALADQRVYENEIKSVDEHILEKSRKEGNLTILLAGRPYHTDPLIQHKLSDMIAGLGVNVITDDIVRGEYDTGRGDTYLVEQWAYANRIIKAGQWAAEQPSDVHFVEMTSFGCGPDAFIQDEVKDIMQRHGKPYTLLKIDDVSNVGSLKLRVRSLIDSLKINNKRGKEKDFPHTKVFTKADRHRKILAPFFTEFLSPLLPPLLKRAGYDVEILPPSNADSAHEGLAYANNEVCYPATLIVGDMVKALKSGKYDPDNIALVMTQTGGQCRATNYTALIKRAMIANGFENVPLIALGVTTNGETNEQDGFEYPWLKLSTITTNTLLFSDVLSKLYYATIVRETVPGISKKLKAKYLRLAGERIADNDSKGLVALAENAAEEFGSYAADKKCPKVGIVGEIFLKFNYFSHQYIEEKLIAKGVEVVPPLISPFFLQEFVNVEVQKRLCLSDSSVPDFVLRTLYALIARWEKKYNKVCGGFKYWRPFTSIYDEAKGANGVVSMAAQFGEGWLLPAEVSEFYRDGVRNVVSLQPFGCIANHIISKGIEKKLHTLYPELNFLSLDFDSGVSEVNVYNRLLLFLDNLSA